MSEQQQGQDEGELKQAERKPSLVEPQVSQVVTASQEDIMKKAKELAGIISGSSEVDFYKRAEKQIDGNEHVQRLISAIKKKQKEIVGFEAFGNKTMTAKIEAEIAVLQDEMDNIPIVQEYQQSQSEINYLLQAVIEVVKNT
ncbi:MAG: YlbF family regulator, partial [Gorillibacterium sp.]|nr:YlbF family regulator [Gorillibacterium sp.]